jgi:electron transfer flavoprotein beta subunit
VRIAVCVKRVPDPEAPASSYRLAENGLELQPREFVERLMSTYDESAVEAALQAKDATDAEVTLVSAGPPELEEFLKESLATGADRAVLVPVPDDVRLDAFATAHLLADALRQSGPYDLVLCGRQASDTDAGLVGGLIAAELGLPSVAVVQHVDVEDDRATVERTVDDGVEVLEISLPALLTITSERYQIRYATLPNILAAESKEVVVLSPGEAGDTDALRRVDVLGYDVAETRVECEVIRADSEEEVGRRLAEVLHVRGII